LVNGGLFLRQFCLNSQRTARDSASGLPGTGKVNSPSAIFSQLKQIPGLEKSMDDLALWPEGTVYVGCKAMGFLPVSYGSVEVIFTQQNNSPIHYVFFLHLVVNSTKESNQKMSRLEILLLPQNT